MLGAVVAEGGVAHADDPTESPQRFTGASTGTCTLFPEPTPGEWWALPVLLAAGALWCWETFPQLFPMAGLSAPTTSMVFPQRFTGTSIGASTAFPEPTPGESAAVPTAAASAYA